MFNLTYNQIGHFNQYYKLELHMSFELWLVIKMYMSISKKKLVSQIGPFEKPWIVIVWCWSNFNTMILLFMSPSHNFHDLIFAEMFSESYMLWYEKARGSYNSHLAYTTSGWEEITHIN
jgi:hypothetical protein